MGGGERNLLQRAKFVRIASRVNGLQPWWGYPSYWEEIAILYLLYYYYLFLKSISANNHVKQ